MKNINVFIKQIFVCLR